MDFRKNILSDIARLECEKISKKVIQQLQRRKDRLTVGNSRYCFMSRKETGLKTIWDEICVQKRNAKFSIYWDYFEIVVNAYIEAELKKVSEPLQKAIYMQTDQANEQWENYESGEEQVEPSFDAIVKYIADEFVYETAWSWKNARIENYEWNELYRDYGEFEL